MSKYRWTDEELADIRAEGFWPPFRPNCIRPPMDKKSLFYKALIERLATMPMPMRPDAVVFLPPKPMPATETRMSDEPCQDTGDDDDTTPQCVKDFPMLTRLIEGKAATMRLLGRPPDTHKVSLSEWIALRAEALQLGLLVGVNGVDPHVAGVRVDVCLPEPFRAGPEPKPGPRRRRMLIVAATLEDARHAASRYGFCLSEWTHIAQEDGLLGWRDDTATIWFVTGGGAMRGAMRSAIYERSRSMGLEEWVPGMPRP